MNPTLRDVVVRIGIVAGVGCGVAASSAAVEVEERPPIFATNRVEDVDAGAVERRAPLLSATAKRRIREQVLSDARERGAAAGDVVGAAAEKATADLNAEGDVVVLERYVVRELRGPELAVPKNRALEMIRTGRLFTSADGRTSIDLLGSSVWNASVGDTGDAKLTFKFTLRW